MLLYSNVSKEGLNTGKCHTVSVFKGIVYIPYQLVSLIRSYWLKVQNEIHPIQQSPLPCTLVCLFTHGSSIAMELFSRVVTTVI